MINILELFGPYFNRASGVLIEMQPKKNSLIDLVDESCDIVNRLVHTDGEITPEIEQALEINEKEIATKVDSYVFIERQLENQAVFFKNQANAMERLSKTMTFAREKIRERLRFILSLTATEEIRGQIYKYVLTDSPEALNVDESKLPPQYLITVTTHKPDKDKIREDLKAGKEIAGCTLTRGKTLRSYFNGKT